MNIKPLTNLRKFREIHEQYYKNEFSYPNVIEFVSSFEVQDEQGNIVTAGGMRLIPEIILLTDKDAPVLDRRIALFTALDYMIYDAHKMNYDGLHVFVQDSKWSTRLKRTGFHPTKGEALVLEI